jgi:hypothetical protein
MNSKRLAWLFPVFVVATLAAALWLVRSIEHAPRAATRTAAAGEFSATRAVGYLSQLLAEGVPHPAGSRESRRRSENLRDACRAGLHAVVPRRHEMLDPVWLL